MGGNRSWFEGLLGTVQKIQIFAEFEEETESILSTYLKILDRSKKKEIVASGNTENSKYCYKVYKKVTLGQIF